ncbi:thymidylate synthase [Candidatus Solirubrobacter pratensis]|uniref:thymidylate synthase n=1 Tax=Candidatus Solirubrobacter pratensis TaxID=1298857 RepID=UPI000427A242|nr:thymidylate synthase [Candidatus Solirubrobacter pratensis]
MGAAAPAGAPIESPTIGEAWLQVAARILREGEPEHYDGLPILELAHVTLVVAEPSADDPLIARYGDPERLRWMRANFAAHDRVEALGGARSYASRLFDYAGSGRDQLAWVIDRLRADPASRSAAITTFEPLTDTTYIPCVSLLDFWVADGAVELVVYAHSIDFGAKGYGNLTELALLQHRVADALERPVGALRFNVKSAHIYDTERAEMTGIVAGQA